MPAALADLIARARAEVVVVSYNDESWISRRADDGRAARRRPRGVEVLAFDSKRYVGAQIGIHSPTGRRSGEVKRLRNVEYLFVAGDADRVASAVARVATAAQARRSRTRSRWSPAASYPQRWTL